MSSLAGVLLGLIVGFRHAFEPDHLTAMATLVGDARDARHGALVGAVWGMGHTCALVVVGVILASVGGGLPGWLVASFELGVAGVLVLLGIRALAGALREGRIGALHLHAHGGNPHVHRAPRAHFHLGAATLSWRPLLVGVAHGLAGSGALTALVFARLASSAERIGYLGLFGVGSIVGMASASAIASVSLRTISDRLRSKLLVLTGVFSIVFGIAWSLPVLAQLS